MNKLKTGMISILLANIINLAVSLITSFILPKYLSIESYSAIKTYQLISSYIALLCLGYVDGMFLKYGGKDITTINKSDLNINLSTYRVLQGVITFIAIIISLVLRNRILLACAISILPLNLIGYFRYLFQSVGEFKKYSIIMYLTTILTFAANLLLLFIAKTDDYLLFIYIYVIIDIVICILLEITFLKKYGKGFKCCIFSFDELVANIKDGILLMLGNFSSNILTSMDRWFVKAFMDTTNFALYSFACSMENFVNVAISPVTTTMYNYFCKEKDNDKIITIRKSIMLFATMLVSAAFPGKYVLEIYLTKYSEANTVIFYLFAAQIFYIINKGVYLNLYKAQKRQNQYFKKLIIINIIGAAFNTILYLANNCKESFALGTLLTAVIWLILSSCDFKELSYSINEIVYLLLSTVFFVVCGSQFVSYIGFLVYISAIFILSFLLMRPSLVFLFGVAKSIIPKYKS